MNFTHLPLRLTLVLAAVFVFTSALAAQDLSLDSYFEFDHTTPVDTAPRLSSVKVDIPDDARKNGVEGTVKVSLILGADGHTRDVQIVDDLPSGLGEAVKKAVENMRFEPASFRGKPQDLKATMSYRIIAWYQESSQDVKKVQLLSKPIAQYPEQFRKEGTKGNVMVAVAFYSDGSKIEVMKSQSTMPNEFDAAAKEGAKSLKFTPAVHKKSKKPVNQIIWVTFEFKP
ncbi:MAG TPA: TonB family protein [Pyrinomonadaceae bacterium]|jgi:TonB family protein